MVTANGGIARAAYARALSAGLEVGALLKNAGLTQAQIRKPEVRIPVRSQVIFLNDLAAHLNDEFLGIHLAQAIDLRELGLIYYVLASSEDLKSRDWRSRMLVDPARPMKTVWMYSIANG